MTWDGQSKVRLAAVRDRPDAPGKRGYTAFRDDDQTTAAWFAVNCLRANVVLYRQLRKPADWRAPIRNEELFQSLHGSKNLIRIYYGPFLRLGLVGRPDPASSLRSSHPSAVLR